MRPGRWVEGGRRRSRVWSQQAGFGGLPQAHQPVEPAHQHVHLLRARAGLGGGLELFADARHLIATLLPGFGGDLRSEEHTSELQSHSDLVCRLLLEKKKKKERVISCY